MTATPHRALVTVGDWSEDGHNYWTVYEFYTSHTVAELQDAYQVAEREIGLTFDSNSPRGQDASAIATNYQDNVLTAFHAEVLTRYAGFDRHFVGDLGPTGGVMSERYIAELFVWFCGTQLPGFEFTRAKVVTRAAFKQERDAGTAPTINGWWGPLNIGVGYGIHAGHINSYRNPTPITKKLAMLNERNGHHVIGSDIPQHRVLLSKSPLSGWREIHEGFAAWVENKCEGRVIIAGEYAYLDSQKDAATLMLFDGDPTKVH